MRNLLLALCCALSFLAVAPASSATDVYRNALDYAGEVEPMTVGQPAPEVTVAQWLGAAPEPLFQPGTVYVVEFMASWCGPCLKSLPHLSALADELASVQFVAIAAAETDSGQELRQLLERQPRLVRFPVAYVDVPTVYTRWMQAGRTYGLPWVFLVDRSGRIAWWGQPFYADFEPALRAMINDDRETLSAAQAKLERRTKAAGWELQRSLAAHIEAASWEAALAVIDQLAQRDAERYWWEQVDGVRILDIRLKRRQEALRRAERLLDSPLHNNPHGMLGLAEVLLAERTPARSALARRALDRASILTHGRNEVIETARQGLIRQP